MDAEEQEKKQYSSNKQNPNQPSRSSILDAVSHSQQDEILRHFNPQGVVISFLSTLPDREKQVITARYGLVTGEVDTLEEIGKSYKLTRERIRQIEKDAIKRLQKNNMPADMETSAELIYKIIESHGGILPEKKLLTSLIPSGSQISAKAVLFILTMFPRFTLLEDSADQRRAWRIPGFDIDFCKNVIKAAREYLLQKQHTASINHLQEHLKTQFSELEQTSTENFENLLEISKQLGQNPYKKWGLANWPQISPRDVGDKSYLVLKHNRRPEHYATITELINKSKFDERVAHKETVHNELIKDKRFVLIGRGIYALKEWGYKKGTVADVIKDILSHSDTPLGKDEIIEKVLKQRLVKKNTIIVALSNRAIFKKTEGNKYQNAD